MRGRFDGLTDDQYAIFEPLLPPPRQGRGRPPAPARQCLNSIIWVLINGAKWDSIPKGKSWSPKSTAHDRLGKWQVDGTWARILSVILGMAEIAGLIDWDRASIDGSFVAGKGGGEDVAHGYKGKGLTLHNMVEGQGMPLSLSSTPASGSEGGQVGPVTDAVNVRTGKVGRPRKRPRALQADKGYDSRSVRNAARKRGMVPMIPRRLWPNRKQPLGRPPLKPIDRWKVERSFAWLQIKFRRLVVRWERKNKYWHGFISLALCLLWVERILSSP